MPRARIFFFGLIRRKFKGSGKRTSGQSFDVARVPFGVGYFSGPTKLQSRDRVTAIESCPYLVARYRAKSIAVRRAS